MIRTAANDLDYLSARTHGRRSRMAEAERLDALCRHRALPDFAQSIFPETELSTAAAFQRHAVQELVRELAGLRRALAGANARLLDWLLAHFQMENLKVLLRACLAKIPFEDCQGGLVDLPNDLSLPAKALADADSLDAFTQLVPRGLFRDCLARAAVADAPQPYFCEVGLDRTYFQEFIARASQLSGEDKSVVVALVQQEADTFHLMLVARGKFHYERSREELLSMHVAGTRIPRSRFADMLSDTDLRAAMTRSVGRALDELPAEHETGSAAVMPEVARIEALAWKRTVRLANRAFRQGNVGFGAIAGYVTLRRAEVANLITISEGLRLGTAADVLRARMIPRADWEGAHV